MKDLLKYPPLYCVIGAVVAYFGPMRESWWGLLVLGSLIGIYAFLAKGEKGPRWQEVGDNCYFIGFVYTLVVIVWALVHLDSEGGPASSGGEDGTPKSPQIHGLLRVVGIALGTSVVGMFCRFVLAHDIKEPEHRLSLEINRAANAATRLITAVEHAEESIHNVDKSLAQAAKSIKDYSGRVEEESLNVGHTMNQAAQKLLEDFGERIADALQKTHFDGVREALNVAVEEHRVAVSRAGEALNRSLEELNGAAKTAVANVESVKGALASLEGAASGGKWAAMNAAVRTFSEQVDKLNAALQTLAEGRAETMREAERDIERLRQMRAAFDGLMRDIQGDAETVAKVKEDYRRAFEQAAKEALEETHRLYGRLIAGAELALAGLDNLGPLAKDLRKIAQEIERREGEQ